MDKLKYLLDKKVAILGNSLPMLILAYSLKKKNINVQVFDESNYLGGAWKKISIKNKKIRTQSNVVVPTNKEEEKNQTNINKILKKNYFVNIKKIKQKIITKYKFKNRYSYNFDNFLNIITKKRVITKKKVKKIELIGDKININNYYKFDFIFIPTYFGINKIFLNNKEIKIGYKIINSEHIVAFLKSNSFKNIFYSDKFNNFFDRVQFEKQGNYFLFTSRITKENKGAKINKVSEELKKIFKKKEILFIKKFKYKNYFRNPKQITDFKKINKFKKIKFVNTQNFLSFFLDNMNYLR